jgi:two-component system sensor histidine kinase/response regulator
MRVLAMTATATSEDRVRCIEAGMDDFITKPIQPALLCQTVARWLRPPRRRAARSGARRRAHRLSRPRAMGGDPAVIDLSILAKLLGWDQHKVRKFAFKFLQSTQDGFNRDGNARWRRRHGRMRELGHRIKSAARTVGALGWATCC